MIFNNQAVETVNMGYLQSIKHLSKYGRPMYAISRCMVTLLKYSRWHAQFREGKDAELIELAADKLTNGDFDPKNEDYVLAVSSQRLCVDTLLVSSEALELADR